MARKVEKERVRIVDIAQELGVSTATVSNVIHGKTAKISERTVKRVQELLEERQYIPSMAGILLAQNDSRIIGVVIHNHEKYEGHVLEDGFISAAVNALSEEIDRAGYFLMVKTTKDWQEIERFASMWNMEGIVLIGFCEQDYNRLRAKCHIPFVVYDGYLTEPGRLVNITIDNFDGGRQAGEYLKKKGHNRVLCISDNAIFVDLERYRGLQSVLPKAELMVVPMEKEKRWDFYEKELERLRQVTAVFAVSDYYAIDLMNFLRTKKIYVPEDISVVGFDDSQASRQMQPALTTIRQDNQERAKEAMRLLGELRKGSLQNETEEGVFVKLPVFLIERESVSER